MDETPAELLLRFDTGEGKQSKCRGIIRLYLGLKLTYFVSLLNVVLAHTKLLSPLSNYICAEKSHIKKLQREIFSVQPEMNQCFLSFISAIIQPHTLQIIPAVRLYTWYVT